MKKILAFVLSFFNYWCYNAHTFYQHLIAKKAKIQVALLLDTSNSMDGLIDQAKSQLWKMVNELATTKKKQ